MIHNIKSYGIPSETINGIMILHKNTKYMVRSQEGDTKLFQGVTLAPFLFIIYLDHVLTSSIDSNINLGGTLKKDKAEDIAQHISHIWSMPMI